MLDEWIPFMTPDDACRLCMQVFGSVESDLLPEKSDTIKWRSYKKDEEGEKTLREGRECLPCYGHRRKAYPLLSIENVVDKMNDAEFAATFKQQRRNRVRREGGYHVYRKAIPMAVVTRRRKQVPESDDEDFVANIMASEIKRVGIKQPSRDDVGVYPLPPKKCRLMIKTSECNLKKQVPKQPSRR